MIKGTATIYIDQTANEDNKIVILQGSITERSKSGLAPSSGKKFKGFLGKGEYETPLILFKQKIGTSISTPIFTDGYKLITASYNGVYLFNLYWDEVKPDVSDALPAANGNYYDLTVEQVDHFKLGISFEATPVVWDSQVMIFRRDG